MTMPAGASHFPAAPSSSRAMTKRPPPRATYSSSACRPTAPAAASLLELILAERREILAEHIADAIAVASDEEIEQMLLDSIDHAEDDIRNRLLIEQQVEARRMLMDPLR